MVVSFYPMLTGVITKHILFTSDGYFADDYPEEKKKLPHSYQYHYKTT